MSDQEDRTIPSEADIMAQWSRDQDILVSVVCTTFNHAAYIEEAVHGFLRQKTFFPFEIIIHDDASTDGTQSIIEKYSRDYPTIIRPILQTENQFSKGGFRPSAYAAKAAKGKYIALCEGDDYWISDDKLQRQCFALEESDDIALCIHNARCIDVYGEESNYTFPVRSDSEGLIPYESIFRTRGQFAPTASMLLKRDVYSKLPSLFYNAPIGDFFIEVFSGTNGVYYIPEKMSVYRRGLPGAWSSLTLKSVENRIVFNQSLLHSLVELKKELNSVDRRFVKFKQQHVYFDLAEAYLDKNERLNASKAWARCFLGAPLLRRHSTIFLRLIGL